MVFAPTNFIEAGWKAECLAVRSSFWWSEAARSRNKQGQRPARLAGAVPDPGPCLRVNVAHPETTDEERATAPAFPSTGNTDEERAGLPTIFSRKEEALYFQKTGVHLHFAPALSWILIAEGRSQHATAQSERLFPLVFEIINVMFGSK
jgi:hypothetical protein